MRRRGPKELQLIDAFVRAFDVPGPPFGPGDDCAVLPAHRNECVTVDALVEGVHFTLGPFSLEDVGHKALAVNLSDLAAMGAHPTWFLCAVAMPRRFGSSEVRALARGMSALARAHGVRLVGGNFTSADRLSVTITAAGEARRPLLRSGAKAGHLLYVSGELGGARVGLEQLGRGGPSVERQKRPVPKLALGRAAAPFASACIDVSDGFAQDLGHVCGSSGVGAVVDVDLLPLSPGASVDDALAGGEDYELLFAVPAAKARAFEHAASRVGERLTRVGRFEGRKLTLVRGGRPMPLPAGFDHFR